ncbi:hypothetical protein Angca_000838 [Angiostrongylus cantonensis]|nr:hypothetical protein Angca_000838 [Angiostrongylus cantonensis]
MKCVNEEDIRNEVLLAVAPLAFCYGGNECNCQPSTSRDIRIRKVSIKPLDGYKLSPNTLYALSTDIDSNSIGFVDVEELRALEGEDRVSITTLPCAPKRVERKGRKSFLFLRKWILRRRSTRRGYPATSMKHSTQGRHLEIYRSKTAPIFHDSASTSSVVLPLPPQRQSLCKIVQNFLCCGSYSYSC